MTGFVIKELPENLHRRLKARAIQNHRSMSKEVLALLEQTLTNESVSPPEPDPFQGGFALTDDFIGRARHEGRE